jgi:hypothetical protein
MNESPLGFGEFDGFEGHAVIASGLTSQST